MEKNELLFYVILILGIVVIILSIIGIGTRLGLRIPGFEFIYSANKKTKSKKSVSITRGHNNKVELTDGIADESKKNTDIIDSSGNEVKI